MNMSHFEYVICKKAMVDCSYVARISNTCDTEYFSNPDAKLWMTKIFEFYRKRNSIPNLTEIKVLCEDKEIELVDSLLRKLDKVDDVYNDDELNVNTETYLREKAVYLALMQVTESFIDKNNKKLTNQEIVDKFTKACSISLIDDIGWDYLERIDDFCEEIRKPNRTHKTGFKWLNKMLSGGWDSNGNALYIFSGQTNVGKSIVLGQIAAEALLDNKTVALISLEMSEMMYAKRLTANLAKLNVNDLYVHTNEIKTEITSLKKSCTGKLIIKEFPTKATSVSRISAYIEDLIRKGIKPDIIIVDYLNLLTPGRDVAGLFEDGLIVSEQLRAMSFKFKTSVITATQLNRSGFGISNPDLTKTGGSIGTSYTADAQMSLWQTDEDKALGIIHLGMQKNRFGPNSGSEILKVEYNTMTLKELDQDSSDIVNPRPTKTNPITDFDSFLK